MNGRASELTVGASRSSIVSNVCYKKKEKKKKSKSTFSIPVTLIVLCASSASNSVLLLKSCYNFFHIPYNLAWPHFWSTSKHRFLLKVKPFAVLFSVDIVLSVKKQWCQLKIRRQTAQALKFFGGTWVQLSMIWQK